MDQSIYNDLIELNKLGGLDEELQGMYDELVSLGEITPEAAVVTGRQAAEDAGVVPKASGIGADIMEAVKSVPRGIVGAARATAEDPTALIGSAAEAMKFTPQNIPSLIAQAVTPGEQVSLQEKAIDVGMGGLDVIAEVKPIRAVTEKAARVLKEAEVHPAIAADPDYSAGMDIFDALGRGEYVEAAKSLGHTALANSGITATAMLVGRYNPSAAKALMGTEIYGQSYQGLTEAGVDKEDAHTAALLNALGQLPLEAIGMDAILSPKLLQSVLGEGVGRVARIAGGSAAEGVTEFLQVLPEAISTEWAHTEGSRTERFKKTFEALADKWPQYLKQGIVEGMVGALIGAPLTGIQVMSEKKAMEHNQVRKEALGLPDLSSQMQIDDDQNSEAIANDFNTIITEAARTEELNKSTVIGEALAPPTLGALSQRDVQAVEALAVPEEVIEEVEDVVKKPRKKVGKKLQAKRQVASKKEVKKKAVKPAKEEPKVVTKKVAKAKPAEAPKVPQKRGRKAVPQYSVQKNVETGEFEVLDRKKKGEVVKSFAKKKDALAFETSSTGHRALELAYINQQKVNPTVGVPLPKKFGEYKADDIVEIPAKTPLPKVGRSTVNKRKTGKIWYPVTGSKTDMTTSSPFQFAIVKEGSTWKTAWKGDKKIYDAVTKKYGYPLNKEGFKDAKAANKHAEKVLRYLVKVYKGQNITGEKAVITNKDLVLKKFGKQNILVRMKKSLMDYYPVHETAKITKVSNLPEYRIYTKFDPKVKQFVYYVQRKVSGQPSSSARALFTTGKSIKGYKVVDSVNDVKAWLLDRIEKHGYYNALPTDDGADIKARLEGAELEGGAKPAKPRPVEKKVEEAPKLSKAEIGKFTKKYVALKAELAKLDTTEDAIQLKALDKERLAIEDSIETIQESVDDIEDDYSEIFGEEVETEARQELEALKDSLAENKLEQQLIIDKQNLRKTQLETIISSASKAFDDKDIQSAINILEQATGDITVTKKVAEPSAVADVSLTAQIRHSDKLQEAAAEQVKTTTNGIIGYKQSHPKWSKSVATEMNGYTVYTTEDGDHTVIQYWDNNGELQYIVAEKKASKKGYTLYNKGESTPETKQAVADLQKHYHETLGHITPFAPGELVTVSEGIQKKTKGNPEKFIKYASSLMKLLKLTDMQVFISYDNEVSGGRGDKYGLYGKYFQYRESSVRRKGAEGTLSKPADTKGKYVIQIKAGMNLTQTIRTYLHELGHIIYYEHFSRANQATKRAVIRDWNTWKNSIKIGKVTYNNFKDAVEALSSSKQSDKVQARMEMQSFNEWFANRVREQVISEEELGGNLVTRFFKGIAKNMSKWVKQVMGISNERDAIKGFLEAIVRSKNLRDLGIQIEKANNWEKKATQDASIGPKTPTKKVADTAKTVKNYVKSEHKFKPSLRRDPWSLLDTVFNPAEHEALADLALEDLTIEEDLITSLEIKEKTPLDWAMLKQFAQPYWVKKQFQHMRDKLGLPVNEGFSKIFDTAINSRRKLSKVLEKALKNNKEFFELNNKAELQQLTEVIYDLDANPQKIADMPNKFNTSMDEQLGIEVVTGLNQEHYDALKDFVMNQMEGSNLSEELAGMYVNLRKSLDRALMRIQNMVKESVKRGETNESHLREMMDKKMLNQLQAYFPHMRFGNTKVIATDNKGDVVASYHYDKGLTKRSLSGYQIAKKLGVAEKYPNVRWSIPKAVKDDSITSILNTPIPIDAMNAFVQSAMSNLKTDATIDSEARLAFEKTFTQAIASQMGEAGYRKHFLQRKNIAGYDKDSANIKQVLHQYLTSVYGSMNKMETMRSFSKEFSKIDPQTNPEEWKYADNYISTYFNHLDQWITKWKQFAFVWYLGARVSTATLNLTQNFITGVNKLNMDAGVTEPVMMKWMWDSGRNLADLARTRGVPVFYKTRLKLPGGRKMSEGEINLIRELYENHDAQDQLIQEMKGEAQGKGMGGKTIDKVGAFMSFAERQNRVSIALTAYRMATTGKIQNAKTAKRYGYEAGQKFSVEDATIYAEDVIADTHWHYGKENLPKFFRDNQKWQSIYVFKSFPMNLMLLLREWGLHEGGRGVAAVLGSLTWAALFGGLKGLPFEEEIDFMYKKIYGQDWKAIMRKKLADGGMKEYSDLLFTGMPSWLKVDLSGSIGVGFSGTQKINVQDNIARNAVQFAEGFIGVPLAFANDMVEGTEYLMNRDYWRALEKMTPKAISSFAKAMRVYNKGLISKKGFTVNFPFNMDPYKYSQYESIIKTFGFTPTSEGKLFEKGEIIRFQESITKSLVEKLAIRVGNRSMTQNEAYSKISSWNRENKDNRINPKDLASAIKSRKASKPDKKRLVKRLKVEKLFKED